MHDLHVDSFVQALEVRRKYPNLFYTNKYQQLIVEVAKINPAFFNVAQKENA